MKKKINMRYLIITIFTLTAVSIIIGVIFDKTEAEKVNGLADVFDVNANGIIAYVSYDEGKPGIYMHTDKKDEQALELSEEEGISDIAFSPDGMELTYTVQTDDSATLYTMDIRSYDTKMMFEDDAYITEVNYNPKDDGQLFYLKAATFENYSPVAQAHPHEFDLYSYDIKADEETKHTDLNTYEMRGLQISDDGKDAYLTMVDEDEIETAEDTFAVGLSMFQIPLDDPEAMSAIDMPFDDIYDLAMPPDESGMIYQAVSNKGTNDTYEYELYYYNFKDQDYEQITDLKTHASSPVLAPDNESIYFIEDAAFPQEHANNSLHKINIDGSNKTSIPLEHE